MTAILYTPRNQSNAPASITASRPWSSGAQDDDVTPDEKQDSKQDLAVYCIYDPEGFYAGWMSYGSWALSAIAHLKRTYSAARIERGRNGWRIERRELRDEQHFADGTLFHIRDDRGDDRYVEIVAGYAVDREHGERLEAVKSAPKWVILSSM